MSGTCIAFAFTCTVATSAVVPCVSGTTTLVQAAVSMGNCDNVVATLHTYMGDALGSVYVCNSDDCNADDSLLLLQPSFSGPAPYVVTAALDLFGYTATTFGAQASAQFADVMRRRLNVDAVEVVSAARRRRRALLATGGAPAAFSTYVHITFRVHTAAPSALTAAIVALVRSDSFLQSLQAGGLTAAWSAVMRDTPTLSQASSASAAAPRLMHAALARSMLALAAAWATMLAV